MADFFDGLMKVIVIITASGIALTTVTAGAPLILLAVWLEDRSRTKRIQAEARLQEAKNAARPKAPATPEPRREIERREP